MSEGKKLEQLQSQKTKLEKDLQSFAQETKNLIKELKDKKQRDIQKSFSELEKNVQSALDSELANSEVIIQLQKEINNLKTRYAEVLSSSQEETANLSSAIENMSYGNNELITLGYLEGTPLKSTMLSVMWNSEFDTYPELKDKSPEQRLEMIFRKINIVLTRFYARKLNLTPDQPLPDYLTKTTIPATERYLMNLLKGAGHDTNLNFLWNISEMSFDKLWDLFSGVKTFSEKFTQPFMQGKALLNFSDFLALPKNANQLQKLKDPYELYSKVLQNEIWTKNIVSQKSKGKQQTETIILSEITWEQFWLTWLASEQTPEELQIALENGKQKIQQELWSIQMVNSPATVKKILGILEKTDTFFEKTQLINNHLLDQMDTFWNATQALKSTFGFDIWKQLKKMPVIGGILNFVFSLLWFSGGIEGLERAWKKRRIDRDLKQPQKEYISETFKSYIIAKQVEDTTAKTVVENYKLKVSEDKLSKFAIDLPLIKEQISQKIKENPELINLSTLRSVKLNWQFDGKDFVEEVKENGKVSLKLKSSLSEEQRTAFVEVYIKMMLEHFAAPKHSEALNSLENADAMAFAIISGITIDKDKVIDGIEAQVLLPSQFYDQPKERNQNTDSSQEKSNVELKWYDGNLMLYDKIPGNEQEKKAFKEKLEEVSKNLHINPNWLMAVMWHESGIDPTRQNKSGGASGLVQFMPATAKALWTTTDALKRMSAVQQLGYVEKMYASNIWWTTYNSLKDLYLKTFFPAAMKYSDNPNYIFESKSEGLSAEKIARQNPVIAKRDSSITMQDFNDYIKGIEEKTVPPEFKNQFV